MSDRAGVLVLGSVNLDLVFRSGRLPAPGETIADAAFTESLGGKGANQAIAAARIGADVVLRAGLGDDGAGDEARSALAHEGVDTSGCRTAAGTPTGRAAVLVGGGGENLIAVAPGANASLTPTDASSGWPTGVGVLLAQLEIPPATVAAGLRAAAERGVRTVLNATPADRLDAVDAVPDLLVVNRGEARALVRGHAPAADEDAGALASRLAAERGIATVVVTDGAAGAAAAIDGGTGAPLRVSAPAVEAIDSTGAGDAFAGTLAALLAIEVDLARALALACAAGALACTVLGAVPSLPTRAAVLALAGEAPAGS